MDNTCRNCGNLVFDKMVICNSCIEELTVKKKTDSKKKKQRIKKELEKESEKWKKEWDIIEGNWFLENLSITNTHFGAVLFHSLIVLILFIVLFSGEYLVVFIARLFVAILGDELGEVGGTGFIVASVIGLFAMIIRYLLRLIYFITNRTKKNQ